MTTSTTLELPHWQTCLLNVVVGLPVTFTLLAWGLGDAQRVLALVAISAVCTLGSSLAVWLPLWWLVGWLARRFYRASRPWLAIATPTLTVEGDPSDARL